ncbi:hypothetical protein GCM10027570_12520 [Streptomonospora sediminis]
MVPVIGRIDGDELPAQLHNLALRRAHPVTVTNTSHGAHQLLSPHTYALDPSMLPLNPKTMSARPQTFAMVNPSPHTVQGRYVRVAE